jgi:hypothetical protein
MAGTVAWVVITVSDLYPYLVAAQAAALRTAALSFSDPVQGDPFTDIMPKIAAVVRTAIASNPKNRLSATANSVPPECVSLLVWLVLEQMGTRISLGIPLNEDQKKCISDSKETLEKIRRWKDREWWLISEPNDPEDAPSQSVGPRATVVHSETRLFTRETLQAL